MDSAPPSCSSSSSAQVVHVEGEVLRGHPRFHVAHRRADQRLQQVDLVVGGVVDGAASRRARGTPLVVRVGPVVGLAEQRLGAPEERRPHGALGQQRPRPFHARREQEVVHHRVGHAVALHRRQHLLRLLHGDGHRFLGDHRHPRGRRVHRVRGVQVVRRGDRDRVQRGVLQHLPVVRVAPLRRHGQHLPHLLQVVGDRIGQRGDLHQLRDRPIPRRVCDPHYAAAADQTQAYRSLHLPHLNPTRPAANRPGQPRKRWRSPIRRVCATPCSQGDPILTDVIDGPAPAR